MVCGHCMVSYAGCMTTKGTRGRVIRVDDDTWAAYGEVCASKGTNRADDLRRYMHIQIKAYRAEQRRIAAEERAAGQPVAPDA
jgi:hypothetical protein